MSDINFLVVDDSATMRRIIVNSLKRLRFTKVDEAENGVDALQKMGTKAYDAILTDWDMPEMGGLDFVTAIRKNEKLKNLPILMITTRGLQEDVIEAMKAGVNNYIIKPFTPDVLKKKLDKILKI